MFRAVLAAIVAVSSTLPALAADYVAGEQTYKKSFWGHPGRDHRSLDCDDEKVLEKITKRFAHQVKNVPHLRDVAITGFTKVHQHRYEDNRDESLIARRYCMATAHFDDGAHRSVWYFIEDGMGYAGYGDNVEFCVSGFDRWNVYDAWCRVAR